MNCDFHSSAEFCSDEGTETEIILRNEFDLEILNKSSFIGTKCFIVAA